MKKLTLAILLVGPGCPETRRDKFASECGDSVLDMQEQCDDGNDVADDGCTDCRYDGVCGNGKTEDPPEECDDGNKADGDGCSSICQNETPSCGNGEVNEGEECDSGVTEDCSINGQVGPLSCDKDCFYDTSACVDDPVCASAHSAICSTPTSGATPTDLIDAYDCVTGVDTTGPEAIYEWTAPLDGERTANLSLKPAFSATLVVLDTGVPPSCASMCIGSGTMLSADTIQITFTAEADHRYVFVIDTPDGGTVMGHSLYIACPP